MNNTNKNRYIFDNNTDSFIEFRTEKELKQYIDSHEHETVMIYNEENDSWIGYPAYIAYKIMLGKLSHEKFINSIKHNLMMLRNDTPNENFFSGSVA